MFLFIYLSPREHAADPWQEAQNESLKVRCLLLLQGLSLWEFNQEKWISLGNMWAQKNQGKP